MIVGNSDDWYLHLERMEDSEEYKREWEQYVAEQQLIEDDMEDSLNPFEI